jgi:transposase InsO family protein
LKASATVGQRSRAGNDHGRPLSAALAEWAEDHNIELDFIKPGKPTQNSYGERSDGSVRFRWVKAPTSAEVTHLTHTLAHRIGRFLEW